MKQAMAKVNNPNVLVNLVSRRVRQLTTGNGRPLLSETGTMGAADIALTEIIENKMAFDLAEPHAEEEIEKKMTP